MPMLARKLLITATEEGLLLHAPNARGHRSNDVQLKYRTGSISTIPRTEDSSVFSAPLEAHGLVGLLDLVVSQHLIVITSREQVASIRGRAIYAVRGVTIIPLDSKSAAEQTINTARQKLKNASGTPAGDDTEESDVEHEADTAPVASAEPEPQTKPEDDAAALEPQQKGIINKGGTFAKNVIENRGKYGRFATKWLSRNGSKSDTRRKQGLSSEQDADEKQAAAEGSSQETAGPKDVRSSLRGKAEPQGAEDATSTKDSQQDHQGKSVIEMLEPRIVRSARLYFSSSGFYFSYDHDISGTLMQKNSLSSDLPLWRRFGELYFWNRHLIDPFVKSARDELVLPLMQGFVGQRTFSIAKSEGSEADAVAGATQDPQDVVAAQETPSKTEVTDEGTQVHEFLLTLISRRSVKRAGLRFLRRGVDDDGNVANMVETEQVLSPLTWDPLDKAFSLVQLRGSIPLHFTQTAGTSSTPAPLLYGSDHTNHEAFKKHLASIAARYGKIKAASLVGRHGVETSIGESYENHAKRLNDEGGINGNEFGFEWFDFHSACKGMKFENVSILIDSLQETLKSFGWIVKQNDRNIGLQSGIIRTNCMDCLDRTNVVQAAIASWVLERQLGNMGLDIDLKADPKTQWFNTLWADNGDACSREYAGTAALKGDYTRTRKRNWTGALSDFSLTLGRYYNNLFGDYFMQANIDYFLGNEGPQVYEDFETNMMTKDYALDIRRIRQNAIETCVTIVLEDPSDLISGWTLSCPKESNTLRSLPFEECVILLTSTAFYLCRFEWDTEKVSSFEKVNLFEIKEIWRGAYVTSALGEANLNESKNYGFAFRYFAAEGSIIRSNTRSLGNEGETTDEEPGKSEPEQQQEGQENVQQDKQDEQPKTQNRVLAFKALPPSTSAAKDDAHNIEHMTEVDLVKNICDQLQKAVETAISADGRSNTDESRIPKVEEHDVISVIEAKKNTGYIESIGYSLKRLVWS